MEPIAHVWYADGILRPVFEADDRQFVTDGNGDRVYGVWFIPKDASDEPLVIDRAGGRAGQAGGGRPEGEEA